MTELVKVGSHRARENTASAQIGIGTLAVFSWGPTHGLGQMALGRKAFGFWGNLLPAGFNSMNAVYRSSLSGSKALSSRSKTSPQASTFTRASP